VTERIFLLIGCRLKPTVAPSLQEQIKNLVTSHTNGLSSQEVSVYLLHPWGQLRGSNLNQGYGSASSLSLLYGSGFSFHFNLDLDPAFHVNADPDLASHQSVANLRPLVQRPSIFSLNASMVSILLHYEPRKLLNFVFNADPDPAFLTNADSDQAS
jgi:hypothetical protein